MTTHHPTPPPPPKLNFLDKVPQIKLWCCLNNIKIRDNNNHKNNKININKDNTTTNNKNEQNNLKLIGCELIVISLVLKQLLFISVF